MMNSRPLTAHLMHGRNINRRNIVHDNNNVITLDKTLSKTRIKHVTVDDRNHFWDRF